MYHHKLIFDKKIKKHYFGQKIHTKWFAAKVLKLIAQFWMPKWMTDHKFASK